jgi:hypothetical protein
MTIHDFISSHGLARFDSPPSNVRPRFAPPCLFESFDIAASTKVYCDPSERVWVALAPTLNRFKLYQSDTLTFEGALDTAYGELRGIKP